MDEAAGTSAVDLPAELGALVDFLDAECRPTAVFYVGSESCWNGTPSATTYLNPAFKDLLNVKNELHDLRRAWQQTILIDSIKCAPQQRRHMLVGGRWEMRTSGEYRILLLSGEELEVNDGETLVHETESVVSDTGQDGLSTDKNNWTQHEIPNMSPWIEFFRNYDWASTAVGPMESWPVMLKHYLLTIMVNPNPRLIVWGKDMTILYNEACVELFGKKHPAVLGQHASFAFQEAWEICKPLIDQAYFGQSTTTRGLARAIERDGFLEEAYWDFTMLPILNYNGEGIGMFEELTDTTLSITGERRRQVIGYLSDQMGPASTLPELWAGVLKGFEFSDIDFPYALLYEVVDEEQDTADSLAASSESYAPAHKKCVLVGNVGFEDESPGIPKTFSLMEHIETGPGVVTPCLKAWKTREEVNLAVEDDTLPQELRRTVEGRGFDAPVTKVQIWPINSTGGNDVLAIIVVGLNPRACLRQEYELHLHIISHIIEKAAALISLPQESRRAQKIADEINSALAQQLRMATIQAERSEAKFYRLASSAPTGMFMFDAGGGGSVYVNDTYLEMLGETRDTHSTKRPESLWLSQVHEDDHDRFVESWKRVTEQKAPTTIEYRTKTPWKSIDKSTGQEITGDRWLLATAFPEIEADGKVATVQGWVTDISHRRFSENLLAQRLEDALENKRQSENFIDMTSHEMRNPLSAILQSADSIVTTLDYTVTEIGDQMMVPYSTVAEIIDAAQTIILCAQHQKRIVDDILTLSKLDANLLVISPDRVQPPMLVEKVLKMYEAEIARADIDAEVCIEQSYHDLEVECVVLDPSRLLQVVINLITNSIKFTQDADVRQIKICLGASLEKPTGAHHNVAFVPVRHTQKQMPTPQPEWGSGEDIYLQIAVYDTGRGLTEEEMKTLFQRFQQASPKTYKQYGGSGLGLFISRELCELQGGQIGVASGDGQTVFTFFVRCKRWIPFDGEDGGPLSRQVSKQSLHVLANNAASPIAYSRRASVAHNSPLSQTTANGAVEQLVNDLTPLSRRSTQKDMSSSTKLTGVVEESAIQDEKDEKDEIHVLIVEDNLINQKVMSNQLRKAGCTVHVANHGMECLDFLERSSFCSASTPLSVVLLDLEMPVMDGLTCIRQIRERQLDGSIISHVPVIAVTANARSEQISVAIDAGMDQVVTKPFRIPELMPQIQTLIAEIAAKKVNGT